MVSCKTSEVAELLEKLKWPVHHIELYNEALTHSSYAHEKNCLKSNERLEFLGDAVLELIISEYFFKKFPGHSEGKLTAMRHSVVNEKTLGEVAVKLQLGHYLKLGKGETVSGGAQKISLLADAVEALLGALFLDQGYLIAKEYVLKLFEPYLLKVSQGSFPVVDYKTLLQEKCQSLMGKTPVYFITDESGAPHEKTFEAVVKMENKIIGKGRGKSKKEAEQSAAQEAYERIEG